MDYNSQRSKLIIPEYGRITQKMAEYICTIPEKEKRNAAARQLIEVMTMFNPQFKQIEEYRHKLWDHLYIITDYKLDVDSPYPKPERPTEGQVRPEPLPYPRQKIRFKNYGKNLERVIEKIKEIQDPEKRKGASETLAYYMKLVHLQWNNENPSDEQIKSDLKMITDGAFELDGDYNLDNIKGRPAPTTSYRDKGAGGYKKKFQKGGRQGNGSNGGRPFRKKR